MVSETEGISLRATSGLFVRLLAVAVGLIGATLWAGCGDDDGAGDSDASVFDAGEDAASSDADVAHPSLELEVERETAGATSLPDVRLTVTVEDAAGEPWQGMVAVEAANPDDLFACEVSPVEVVADGVYGAVISSPQSGEVRITVEAEVEGEVVEAEVTVVFLAHLSAEWCIPTAVAELNTVGHEDSIAVSPNGQTLFFSYTPVIGCAAPSSDWTPQCEQAVGPHQPPQRPCVYGVDEQGGVTRGLYGSTDDPPAGWPFTKQVFNSYAAHRDGEGRFTTLDCIGFEDDGVLTEVSPSSGMENPAIGRSYNLFFGFPDWLNFDGDSYYGTVFAVAEVVAGQPAHLGGPVTAGGEMPEGMIASLLTGPVNQDLEQYDVGEFRVFEDPDDGNHHLYFETKDTEEGSGYDLVTAPLEGTYPVGDWGRATALPAPVNSQETSETFPWPVVLDDGGAQRKKLFFNRGPIEAFTEPSSIMVATWQGAEWGEPVTVMETDNSFGLGTVFVVALPSVAISDRGTEMFFVYSYISSLSPSLRWNHQIGVTRRQ